MRFTSPGQALNFQSDRKTSYQSLFRDLAGRRYGSHLRVHSKKKRDRMNALFPINHTFAMMRDSVSRLVRRNWAASKLRERLEVHFWVWAVYRNYVRGITVKTTTTPGMALGVVGKALRPEDVLRWRWPLRMESWGQ